MTTSSLSSQAPNQTQPMLLGNQAHQLMRLSNEAGWAFSVLGIAPMPHKAVRHKDWLLIPAQEDKSAIPERTLERVQAIFAAGLRPKGFVMVHEAPMQLPAGDEAEVIDVEYTKFRPGQVDFEWGEAAVNGLNLAAKALRFTAMAAIAVGSVVLPAIVITAATLLDPILVAVTEEDVWIEIDRWWA